MTNSFQNLRSCLTKRHAVLCLFTIVLSVLYGRHVLALIQYASRESLYSHLLLIPFISIYLSWPLGKKSVQENRPMYGLATVMALAGVTAYALYRVILIRHAELHQTDYLSLISFSYVSIFLAGFAVIFGRDVFRAHLFPLLFLYFLAPIPEHVRHGLEVLLQHASADASHFFLSLSGTPVLRDGLIFKLPGLVIEVARECSGIRSTLVLFITSLLAAHMFLRSFWKKTVLALFVLPVAVARNAIRIVTISLLTVHVDPGVIDGPLHTRGGPLFFVISLIPFFVILLLLWKTEKRVPRSSSA